MRRRTQFGASAVTLVAIASVGLTACGSDSGTAGSQAETTTQSTSTAPEPEASESESTETAPDAPGSGDQPVWALPVTTPGTMLTSIEAGDVTVDVYQVGTAPANDTGSFVNPDTNTPLIEVGDTLVFLNYVVTNNGDPIDLGANLVDVSARYDDWPYLQGMDGLTGDELWTAQGINGSGLGPDGYSEAGVYPLGAGQSYSFGDNFEYQPGSPIQFDVTYTPVDTAGELLSDERVEAKGTSTIS